MKTEEMIKELQDVFGLTREDADDVLRYVCKKQEEEMTRGTTLANQFIEDYVCSPYDEEEPTDFDIMIEEGDALYEADAFWSDEANAYLFPDGSLIEQGILEDATKAKQSLNETYWQYELKR